MIIDENWKILADDAGRKETTTYTGDAAVPQVNAELIQHQKPRLGIAQGLPGLAHLEGAGVHHAGLVGHCTLDDDCALFLREKDDLLGRVWKQEDQPEHHPGCYSPENEEEQLPAVEGSPFDGANGIGDDSPDDGGDTVSQEPGGLAMSVVREAR